MSSEHSLSHLPTPVHDLLLPVFLPCFPYEYVTDIDKLAIPELPDIKEFYSPLKGSGASEEKYQHAQNEESPKMPELERLHDGICHSRRWVPC